MKAASLREIKIELKSRSHEEIVELCLQLSKFKKENKELLTYLLYEADDEAGYIRSIKEEIELQFEEVTKTSLYFITKSVRKILRNTKKYIRYSKKKETEVELLLHFIKMLASNTPINQSSVLNNILDRQIFAVRKAIATLHEDLQYDYTQLLKEVLNDV